MTLRELNACWTIEAWWHINAPLNCAIFDLLAIHCQAKQSLRLPPHPPPPTIFSDAFSWMKSLVVWLKWHRKKFVPKDPVDNRCTIIWTNADPIHWRIYASPGGGWFNLYWLTIYCTLSKLFKSSCNENTKIFIHEHTFGNVVDKMPAKFAKHQCVNV